MELVDTRGQFSIRGGIIDIFTPDSDNPYRVELFDTEVDSIRTFDIDTQRSVENLKFIEVYPAEQMLADKSIFNDAADNLYKEYTAQVKRLVKKGDDFTEAAENLTKRRDELCEYIRNVSNLQLLENYLHYFYEKDRVSLGITWKKASSSSMIPTESVNILTREVRRPRTISKYFWRGARSSQRIWSWFRAKRTF